MPRPLPRSSTACSCRSCSSRERSSRSPSTSVLAQIAEWFPGAPFHQRDVHRVRSGAPVRERVQRHRPADHGRVGSWGCRAVACCASAGNRARAERRRGATWRPGSSRSAVCRLAENERVVESRSAVPTARDDDVDEVADAPFDGDLHCRRAARSSACTTLMECASSPSGPVDAGTAPGIASS